MNLLVRSVPPDIHRKMQLLSAKQGLTFGRLLTKLVNREHHIQTRKELRAMQKNIEGQKGAK